MRSLAAQSDVDALESLDLLAQAQALCDEARRAQLALELAQARTADELSAAIQNGKRVAAAACRAEEEERARLRRQAPAATRQRKEAEDAARRAAEVKAAKRAKQRSCRRELRAKQRQDLGETGFKRRVACDRKAQRTAAKAEDSCAGGVTSVWGALGGWSATR